MDSDIRTEIGSLELVMGPMFSGKSTELLRRLRIQRVIGRRGILVKHTSDVRTEGRVATHDGVSEVALAVERVSELLDRDLQDVDVVAIDEGQFFPDLVDGVDSLVAAGKAVIVSALDGDYKMNLIGDTHKLVPRAEEVVKLRAICSICKTSRASFTSRRVAGDNVFEIGGHDKYYATCRKCHTIPK